MMSQNRNNSLKYETSRTSDRVLDIFEFLGQFDTPQTVLQISQHLNLPKATAFRLVTALKDRGYLAQDRPRGGYRLGMRLMRLGTLAQRQIAVARVAPAILQRLALETNESCQVSVREGKHAICVARVVAPDQREWSLTGDVGTIFPLHATAVGKVLIAYAPEADQVAYLGGELPASTPQTITAPDALRSLFQGVRSQGFAGDEEEFRVGLWAVAVPVWGVENRVVATIGVTLLRQDKVASDAVFSRILPALTRAARELSVELGATF